MDFESPASLADALSIKASRPDAVPVAGGTDVMVGINSGRLHPQTLLDLTRIPELTDIARDGPLVRLGAGVE